MNNAGWLGSGKAADGRLDPSLDGRLDPSLDGRPYRTPMPQGSYTPTAVTVDHLGRVVFSGFTWRFDNPATAPGQADMIWFVERVLPPVAD